MNKFMLIATLLLTTPLFSYAQEQTQGQHDRIKIQNKTNHLVFCTVATQNVERLFMAHIIMGEAKQYNLPTAYDAIFCSPYINQLNEDIRSLPEEGIGRANQCNTDNWILRMENDVVHVMCNKEKNPFENS